MNTQSFKQTSAGSHKTTSPINQRTAGNSTVNKPIQDDLLTRKELALRWHCCAHTIARRTDLKPVRFTCRMIRYRLSDVLAIEAAAIA
jgi:hypothetical protein